MLQLIILVLLLTLLVVSNIAMTQERLPFIGTKYFNFIGEGGTEESITVREDGTTTLKFYGLVNQGVIWKGKFSNPLTLFSDGDGLLFKDEKVYRVTGKNVILKGCKGETIPCEASLSNATTTQRRTLPFIGTKYFNFAGGSGTWQSITIQKNGTAILRFYGVISQSTTWKGKFTNPLNGFLFKKDKVYATTDNGEVKKGCNREGIPCETSLSSLWDKGLFGAYAPEPLGGKSTDPRKIEADNLLQVGSTQFARTSQIDLAISYFQQSLGLYREIKDRPGEEVTLGNLGLTYGRLGIYTRAIDYFQHALAIANDLKDKQNKKKILDALGQAYTDLATEREEGEQGLSLSNLGRAYTVKAIDYREKALLLARELKDWQGERTSLMGVGLAYFGLGNYAKTVDCFQQVLILNRRNKDRQSEGSALSALGLPYAFLGDYDKAVDYAQKGLATIREGKNKTREGSWREGSALNNLGAVLFKAGRLPDAKANLLAAIEVQESRRSNLQDSEKVVVTDANSNSYRTLQRVLIAEKNIESALEISERSRARSFVELLASRITDNPWELTKPIKLDEIKQVAKQKNVTLVEYSNIYNEKLFIWVIQPTGEVAFRQLDLQSLRQQNTSLDKLVERSRKVIGVGARASIEIVPDSEQLHEQQSQYLQKLHELLIEPIADLLPKEPNDRVIFIPQGELFLVSFPALQDKDGKSLLEKHTILTAPSIQILDLTRKVAEKQKNQQFGELQQSALVVGNPTMPKIRILVSGVVEQLASLLGAEREADDVAGLLKTKAFIGNQATKSAILSQLPNARLIHLATHGLLDDFTGLGIPGAIALAPDGSGEENDGFLTAEEILDMKLSANLVVLSACDTGRGKITGDGVIGLSRSLITAGVPSVIVSLWSVPDAPTAALMVEFYRNWREKKMDKAQALRQAMLTTMKIHPNPRDWAAFTLIGEAE